MMLFSSHIAFALQLITVVLATFLIAMGVEKKLGFAKVIGVIVLILAVLGLLHTLYCSYMMWNMVSVVMSHGGGMMAAS